MSSPFGKLSNLAVFYPNPSGQILPLLKLRDKKTTSSSYKIEPGWEGVSGVLAKLRNYPRRFVHYSLIVMTMMYILQ